jgi:hypothetical protein
VNIVSSCCTAEVYEDTDICRACKEHCDSVDLDEEEEEE